MSFRTNLLPTLLKLRKLPGPDGFDVYTSAVVLRTRTWSGGEVKLGTATDVDVELSPRPKVKEQGFGELEVGPVNPRSSAGGYTPQELNPSEASGVESYYVVTGPDDEARPYKLVAIDTSKAFKYTLRLQPLDRAVPF